MKSSKYNRLGLLTALISFILGTSIFGLYYLTSSDNLLFIGYGYILLAGFFNLGILVFILLKAAKDKVNRRMLLKTCGLMLLNIPVMLLYCWFAIILLDTMRITFINSTKTTLTNINIVGCETKHIDKIEVGQSKTIWVGISGDCTININYRENNKPKEDVVVGYTCSGMGQKMEFRIGGQNDQSF